VSLNKLPPLRHNQPMKKKSFGGHCEDDNSPASNFDGTHSRRTYPGFYCAAAKLDVELDGFQHGLPEEFNG